MNEELIAKAKEAKSVEELLALAKENNYPLTEEEAQNYYNQFHVTGELSDDELDQVGGGCGDSGVSYNGKGYMIIPDIETYSCSSFRWSSDRYRDEGRPKVCRWCGDKRLGDNATYYYCTEYKIPR